MWITFAIFERNLGIDSLGDFQFEIFRIFAAAGHFPKGFNVQIFNFDFLGEKIYQTLLKFHSFFIKNLGKARCLKNLKLKPQIANLQLKLKSIENLPTSAPLEFSEILDIL